MNNNDNFVVIMAGGIGSRFWPFSRTSFPKQFHDVLGTGKTLIQQTAHRFKDICPQENIYVVTNKEYYDLTKEQLPFLEDHQILLEPIGRNTTPCIAYACFKIKNKNAKANIVVAPADHIILDETEFHNCTITALEQAISHDILVTLGIQPSRPDTGYGYIQFLNEEHFSGLKKVKTFTEKPDVYYAEKFIESGDYVWNAGIFIFNVDSIIASISHFEPDIAETFLEGNDCWYSDKEQAFIDAAYTRCKSISIDNAIMEKADNVHVVLSDFGWSDLGTWKSLYEVREKDENANVLDGQVISYDSTDCIVKTPSDKLVVVQGLEGYIVAEYNNVLMICKKEEEQKVKEFVSDIKTKKLTDFY